ncbi:MAG: pyruvate kinase [Actinobacteria bacterium]|nr:pyruvate kinase [Actinomycetota bacterium]
MEQIFKKTKVICTIGPSSSNKETLESFIPGGMDIARINTSHTPEAEVKKLIDLIRKVSRDLNSNTAIMLDLPGSKIRVDKLKKEIQLADDQDVIFTTTHSVEAAKDIFLNISADISSDNPHDKSPHMSAGTPVIRVDYEKFINDLKPGCTVFIDDGLLELQVLYINKDKDIAKAKVIRGGVLKSRKGINLPGISVSADSVTEKDIEFLNLGIDLGVDFIAQSFVRNADDIKKIKEIILKKKSHQMVIAKIEKHEAVSNFDSILRYADGIMVARGDLGIELPEEDIPNIQKTIISKANIVGKPVITATQMLDSMIRNPRPTRAEVSDVANAILDGSDAVMLSGETAIGSYPLKALQTMVRVIIKTEEALDYEDIMQKKFKFKKNTVTEAISFAACEIARSLNAAVIITSTQSGSTARQISKSRPKSIIIGASPHEWVMRQLMMTWGVIPMQTKFTENIDRMIEESIITAKKLGFFKAGERVVITAGVMVNKPGSTNFINVGEIE